MNSDARKVIEQFENLEIPASQFGHREHVEVAFHMLNAYEYVEACTRYAATIKAMAAKHGAPEKYNATITFAFISIIAERMSNGAGFGDVELLLDQNPDLLDKDLLGRWYSRERLTSAQARSQFVLPNVSVDQAA